MEYGQIAGSPKYHLLVSDLYSGDAIGNFVLSLNDALCSRGLSSSLYAERHGDIGVEVHSYTDFFASVLPEDILIYQFSNDDPAFEALMETPCRKIVFYHNITPGHFFAPYSPEIARMLEKGREKLPLLAKADAVVANSAWSLEEVLPLVSKDAPRMVFPPFFAKNFSKRLEAFAGARKGRHLPYPYLLVLGRVVPHKGVEDALSIFSHLQKLAPDLHLVIAGSHYPPYVEALSKLIDSFSEAVSSKIHITGALSEGDIATLLAHAKGLLHTGRHEGFAMPLAEAMGAGIPVFAVRQPAMLETLGGAGIPLPFSSPEDAARIIVDVLDGEKIEEIVVNQKKRIEILLRQASESRFFDFLAQI